MLDTELKALCKRLNAVILPGVNPHLERIQVELEEYFSGKRKDFTVPLHVSKSDFQQSILKILDKTSYGVTDLHQSGIVGTVDISPQDYGELIALLSSFENQIVGA